MATPLYALPINGDLTYKDPPDVRGLEIAIRRPADLDGKPDGKAMSRDLEFKDFKEAFGFMSQVAEIADRMDRHRGGLMSIAVNRAPEMKIKSIAILLAYGLFLQVGRLGIDHYLSTISAPLWTYNVTLIGLAILWLGGGNLIYYFVPMPREDRSASRSSNKQWNAPNIVARRHSVF